MTDLSFANYAQDDAESKVISSVPYEWNETAYPHSLAKCVHELFEEQAALTPDEVAVEGEEGQLTFRGLNERANKVARALRKRGVVANTFVGISVERSLDSLVGIYGILKAGGAYVPLDPIYPKDRLAYMLQAAKVGVLLTQKKLQPLFGDITEIDLLSLDADWSEISQEEGDNLEACATPDNIIYLIFTSGSTGRPKATAVYHRGFTNLLLWFVTEFGISAADHNLLVSSLSFDLTQKNLYAPLIRGGRLHLAPEGPYDPQKLSHLISDHGITLINCTPSAFYPLIEPPSEEAFNRLATLRIAFLGGEPISIPRLRPWMIHPNCRTEVANTYGPTECTDICGSYRMSRENIDRYDFVPLGRPIHNVQLVVVNKDLKLCSVGESGELCVAGAGIGAGYINDPEMTAVKFISNPFTWISGPTIYRTGDQARWLPDGIIEFLGRLDHQIKIRGFRIELHEIESVLNTHHDVLEAIVVVKGAVGSEDARLICYVMPREKAALKIEELRKHLLSHVPAYMVPAAFYVLPQLPLSPNGKVDRRALQESQEPLLTTVEKQASSVFFGDRLEWIISNIWMQVLDLPQVPMDENFFDIGGNSLQLVKVHAQLKTMLEREFSIIDLFEHTTIRRLAAHFRELEKLEPGIDHIDQRPESGSLSRHEDRPIIEPSCLQQDSDTFDGVAVISMSGRFPGAKNVDEFWQNLVNGLETISRFEDHELEHSCATPERLTQGQTFIGARAVLEDVEQFDADFFRIYPKEAEVMDPQHRLFLECAWEALETSGYDPDRYPGLIGVYAGSSMNTYLLNNLCRDRAFAADFVGNYQVGSYQVMLGNDKDFMPTRISYKLNLKGPSMSIQTACSTSLVAICQACTSLLSHQCDMALAGGVSISFPQKRDYFYQEGGMVSADGFCRVFDVNANGTVFGHGVAVVVLKRMQDAVADGDHILAVIKGTAVNNDGSEKIGFAAPSLAAQSEVVAKAQEAAGVAPETVSYIEAHGTGTPLGDPVEIAALTQAFRRRGAQKNNYCAIGTAKTYIGHLDVASGATGLIKTILQLQHEMIPPLLHFQSPNPQIDFTDSPFFPVEKTIEWKRGKTPRRAGISAFGIGGTNAHVVVEEAPFQKSSGPSRSQQVLVMSAKSERALQGMSENLAAHLEAWPGLDFADVAFTLQQGRKLFPHRRAIVAADAAEAIVNLRSSGPRKAESIKAMPQEPVVGFLFPGQGVQYLDMGRELYQRELVFRNAVDQCAQILRGHLDMDLRTVLYPDAVGRETAEVQINQTWVTQLAIFTVEYALARLWIRWGVKPAVLLGHSIGEYVAAVIAETFTLEDALSLLSVRASLMQALPPGSMMAVRMSAGELLQVLPAEVSVAAINSSMLCTVSGPTDTLKELQRTLDSKGIATLILQTSHAFHSAMMDPMLPEFATAARQVACQPPKIPWVSTCTGEWMNPNEQVDGEYWVQQIRQPVCFSAALEVVINDPNIILLEVGPGQGLTQLAQQHAKKPKGLITVATMGSLAEPGRELAPMLAALGQLWCAGISVDWEGFSAAEVRRRVPLPTYPFERKSYWVAPVRGEAQTTGGLQAGLSHHSIKELSKEPEMQIEPVATAPTNPSRKAGLMAELRELFQDYSGTDHSQTDTKDSFFEMGFDSLFLTQIAQGVQNRFGVKVTFRQMLSDLETLDSLASFLDSKLPAETVHQPAATVMATTLAGSNTSKELSEFVAEKVPMKKQTTHPPESAQPPTSQQSVSFPVSSPLSCDISGAGNVLHNLVNAQLQIMQMQLQVLGGGAISSAPSQPTAVGPLPPTAEGSTAQHQVEAEINAVEKSKPKARHILGIRITREVMGTNLTTAQKEWVDDILLRYQEKFAGSKARTQQYRKILADPRTVSGFNPEWKEIIFPIVTVQSKGSKLWDIDGNEFIDTSNGFGPIFFGHSPDFISTAIKEQIDKGVETGPQSPLAGEVAELFCELTGNERCTFACSGSEAVLGAIRLARTVTGRSKVVMFEGSYHGIFDEVICRPGRDYQALPAAPGIPRESTANMLVLPWGEEESLAVIKKLGKELAAVLVEPVQSRKPAFHDPDYIKALREITAEHGAALILDEVVTGFRVHPGGIRKRFAIDSDLATYGKVAGGGYPIGIIGGKAKFMDALDGGYWQYGDSSIPEAGVTFFAGTFVRHPLSLAATKAVLTRIQAEGGQLQEDLDAKTARMAADAKSFIAQMKCEVSFEEFSSFYYVAVPTNVHWGHLLFIMMTLAGIHIQQFRPNFLTTEHTQSDIQHILTAFKKSLAQLIAHGLIEGDQVAAKKYVTKASAIPPGARLGKNAQGEPAYFIEDPEQKGHYVEVGKP